MKTATSPLAQSVERGSNKPKVSGSIPLWTKFFIVYYQSPLLSSLKQQSFIKPALQHKIKNPITSPNKP